MNDLILKSLESIPLIEPGDDLPQIIYDSIVKLSLDIQDGDIFVIAQKVVSKSENRYVYLNEVKPSIEAIALSKETKKDPRLVQVILQESERVVRTREGVIVVENKLGFVHANAGIDRSNIDSLDNNPKVLLLPKDPDKSAEDIRLSLEKKLHVKLGVIINDSAGRAWRNGTTGIAIGSSGVLTLSDLRGKKDLYGRLLEVTQIGLGDELASSASILMGQADEGLPVVLIKGLMLPTVEQSAKELLRLADQDLFR
ncbi:MAG: coenzyme F420-0:L-glutamate ligase [SAR86 cluster bacterium]|jgi:coenzyme F420-0:L-glutamate ligase / coenzyme F420-1:gamma-L-glutamate ligase|nr:coenzyme F420-0:L-glutamate ligase [SAR86 cluster bacterium]